MNNEDFEMYLRQGNMTENTINAYLYAIKEYYSRHRELNKRNLLIYKTYLIETFKSHRNLQTKDCESAHTGYE